MPDPLLKPKPLPPHSSVLDKIEYVLEYAVYLLAVRIEDKPSLSGCLSGLIMGVLISGVLLLLWWLARLLFHWLS
jgi:hypothetical protein